MPRKRQVGGGGGGTSCLAVPVFMGVTGQAVGTQAAADSQPQMSPEAGHATKGMKGWSGKTKLVGKHLG